MTITANDIKGAIINNHTNDLVFIECNTGSAYMHNIRKFDVWVMKKTWSPFTTIGYEVKVSRQDFLNDNKWQDYLPFCNEFYFITTGQNIINKDELPKEVGLKYVSKNCKRIFIKKKAAYRDVIIPQEIFAYILMWRVKEFNIHPGVGYESKKKTFEDIKKEWEDWLSNKEYKRQWGLTLPHRIEKKIKEWLVPLQGKNEELNRENEKLKPLKEFCDKNNIKLYGWDVEENFKNKLKELELGINGKLENWLNDIIASCCKIKKIYNFKKEQ